MSMKMQVSLSGLAVSCGVGHRCGLDPQLLWTRQLELQLLFGPLAWELPYAECVALKNKQNMEPVATHSNRRQVRPPGGVMSTQCIVRLAWACFPYFGKKWVINMIKGENTLKETKTKKLKCMVSSLCTGHTLQIINQGTRYFGKKRTLERRGRSLGVPNRRIQMKTMLNLRLQ